MKSILTIAFVAVAMSLQAQKQMSLKPANNDSLPPGVETGLIDLGPMDKTKGQPKAIARTEKRVAKKAIRKEAKATRKLQRVTLVPNPEHMPQPGYDVDAFIASTMKYPAAARQSKTSGQVYVQFIVHEDGHVSDAKVMKGLGSGCDEEALRVISMLPAYKTPAKEGATPVPTRVVKPVRFKL